MSQHDEKQIAENDAMARQFAEKFCAPKPTESDAPHSETAPNQPCPTTISQVDEMKLNTCVEHGYHYCDVCPVCDYRAKLDVRCSTPEESKSLRSFYKELAVDAPKDDARTWLLPDEWLMSLGRLDPDYDRTDDSVGAICCDLRDYADYVREAYALPFQQQRDAAQKLPVFNERKHVDRMIAAGCKISVSDNLELVVQNERAERAESESAALRKALDELWSQICMAHGNAAKAMYKAHEKVGWEEKP